MPVVCDAVGHQRGGAGRPGAGRVPGVAAGDRQFGGGPAAHRVGADPPPGAVSARLAVSCGGGEGAASVIGRRCGRRSRPSRAPRGRRGAGPPARSPSPSPPAPPVSPPAPPPAPRPAPARAGGDERSSSGFGGARPPPQHTPTANPLRGGGPPGGRAPGTEPPAPCPPPPPVERSFRGSFSRRGLAPGPLRRGRRPGGSRGGRCGRLTRGRAGRQGGRMGGRGGAGRGRRGRRRGAGARRCGGRCG